MTTKPLKLPSPDRHYHYYVLSDHSRIYPSGVVLHAHTGKCKWFLWRCTGCHEEDCWDEQAQRRMLRLERDGEIVMQGNETLYFDTPEEALRHLNGGMK